MKRATAVVLSGVFIALVVGSGAALQVGAAHLPARDAVSRQVRSNQVRALPGTVRFSEDRDRGLLAEVWINGRGPYRFAIDTGAGMTVISQATAGAVGLRAIKGRSAVVAGLSGKEVLADEVAINQIALGSSGNIMPASLRAIVVQQLPSGVDGILDPTDAYAPLGYTIDLPRRHIRAFDPRVEGLSTRKQPVDGAVVPWIRDRQSKRPFVRLSDGRLALIDTGSTFGLAVSAPHSVARDHSRRPAIDVGGGTIQSTRVQPTTVRIGALVLQGVPTDLLNGVEKGAPTILGRDALYPFRITFDPSRRLIEIAPSGHDSR